MMGCLIDLPVELVAEIGSFLALDALLAMKLTHPRLSLKTSLDAKVTKPISRCSHLSIREYLVDPYLAQPRQRCVLCKAVYPRSMFRSVDDGTDMLLADLLELPYRICLWHISSMTRLVQTKPGGKNGWVSQLETMCMHCGSIQSWNRCSCECDSCGLREIRTFTRFLNNQKECKAFSFQASNDGETQEARLVVNETCLTGK
jgi:hypothetical protein